MKKEEWRGRGIEDWGMKAEQLVSPSLFLFLVLSFFLFLSLSLFFVSPHHMYSEMCVPHLKQPLCTK